MSDKSTEKYLDNLLYSMGDAKSKPITNEQKDKYESDASRDDFLKQFEDELDSGSYDDFINEFEMELEQEKNSLAGNLDDIQTPAPEDNDASLDEVLSNFDKKMQQEQADNEKKDEEAANAAEMAQIADAVGEFDAGESCARTKSSSDNENAKSKSESILGSENVKSEDDNGDDGSKIMSESGTDSENISAKSDADNEGVKAAGDIGSKNTENDGAKSDTPAVNSVGLEEIPLGENGEPDLGGNSNKDLLDILDEKNLSDIGDLLSGEATEGEAEDGIDDYAKSQMDGEDESGDTQNAENKSAKGTSSGKKGAADGDSSDASEKKPGFFKRLLAALFKEPKADNADDSVDNANPDAKTLSDENQKILDELDAAEGKAKKPKKEKKKKEKKAKAPKPKKEKPKKPKKEKKPKEKSNEPKLPKWPVRLICLFVISLAALVLICTSLLGNTSRIADAWSNYNNAVSKVSSSGAVGISLYEDAYANLSGLSLEGEDEALYNKLTVLAAVSKKYSAYESFKVNGYESMAIDSLVCAAGRCEINAENAAAYNCESELEALKNVISDTLTSTYGMSYDEAIEIYSIDNRDKYTLTLKEELEELGLGDDEN